MPRWLKRDVGEDRNRISRPGITVDDRQLMASRMTPLWRWLRRRSQKIGGLQDGLVQMASHLGSLRIVSRGRLGHVEKRVMRPSGSWSSISVWVKAMDLPTRASHAWSLWPPRPVQADCRSYVSMIRSSLLAWLPRWRWPFSISRALASVHFPVT